MENDELLGKNESAVLENGAIETKREKNEDWKEAYRVGAESDASERPKKKRSVGRLIADIIMTLLGLVSPFLLAFALDPTNSTPGLFHIRERYSEFAVFAFIFYFVCIFYWLFRLVLGKKSLREVRFSGWWVFLFIVVVPIGVRFITLFYIVLSGPLVFLAKGLRALMDKF